MRTISDDEVLTRNPQVSAARVRHFQQLLEKFSGTPTSFELSPALGRAPASSRRVEAMPAVQNEIVSLNRQKLG